MNDVIANFKRERVESESRISKTLADVYEVERRIYSALVETAKLIPELRQARFDYVDALQAGERRNAGVQARLLSGMINRLSKGITELLRSFPESVWKGNGLPSHDEVIKIINAKK